MKQVLPKMIFTLLASALFAAMPTFGDVLDFAALKPSGTSWSFTGYSSLSPSIPYGSVTANGPSLEGSTSETFTTGAFIGVGSETVNGPYLFGPSAPGSYDTTGCVAPPGAAGCSEVTLFSGEFDGTEVVATATKSYMGFSELGVIGINSAVAAALGVLPATYSGVAAFNLSPADSVMGGNLTLASTGTTAITEPASLALIGTALVVVVVGLRKYRT